MKEPTIKDINANANRFKKEMSKFNNEFKYIKPDDNNNIININNKNRIKRQLLNDDQIKFLNELDIDFNNVKTNEKLMIELNKVYNLILNLHELKINGAYHYAHHLFKHSNTIMTLCENEEIDFNKINSQLHILNLKVGDLKDIWDDNLMEKEPSDVKEEETAIFSMKGINRIYYGAPGTGKSYQVDKDFPNYDRVTFHPEFTYFDFIGGLKPDVDENKVISYEFISGPFTNVLVEAYKKPDKNIGLIIEELNRANTAAVFGDIFQLLDRDDEGKSEYSINNIDLVNHIKKELKKEFGIEEYDSFDNELIKELNNGKIRIPSNFSLIATMNSADQGVYVMDSAFKRRWEFKYIPIKFEPKHYKIKIDGFECYWGDFCDKLNDKLAELEINEDKHIGPYFLREDELKDKKKVSSKLLIYLWDDVVRYKRGKLFKLTEEKEQFSKVIFAFEDNKQIFIDSLHEKLNNGSVNNLMSNDIQDEDN